MALRAEKHFRDYEVVINVKDGKTVREFVYCGDLYRRKLDKNIRRKERIGYLIGSVVAALLVLTAISRPAAANTDGFFAACSLLALIPAFCVAEGAAEAFFRTGDLKTENYRERLIMLRVMPIIGAALNLLLTLGYLIGLACDTDAVGANGLALSCALAAAAIYTAIAVREMRIHYQMIPGAHTAAEKMADDEGGKP